MKNEEENSEGEDADLAKTMRPECQLTLRSGAYIPERQPLKESEKEKSKVKGRGKEHEDGGETSEKPKFTVGDFKVVAHLRKIPALLSVFDALMMSQELRNVLVYALQNPEKFQAYFAERNMQEAMYTSCTASISFTDDDLSVGTTEHNRPLYITGECERQKLNRILIDPGSSINPAKL